MTTRLVLGCGSLGYTLVEVLADRPGRVAVVAAEGRRVETLRADGIDAREGDPTDPELALTAAGDGEVATVVIGGADPAENLAAARMAAERFPDAFLLAYAGEGSTPENRQAMGELADELVDPGGAVAEEVLAPAGREGHRVRNLQRLLRDLDGRLAVVMHDNPDPDAIASAVALVGIAEAAGCPADACYSGDIAHQENRALVNLLEYDLVKFGDDPDLQPYAGIALVDHSRPGVNDHLPPDTPIDVVIDHHPPRQPVEARFVDLRSDAGATSTLLTDYLRRLNVEPDEAVATGLLYGIRVDTREFSREVSVDDYEAAAFLLPYVDSATLERVESPSISPETLDTLGRAIRNREVRGSVLTTCVGPLRDRDALAQAADQLLDLEGVNTSLVYGYDDGVIYASARARGAQLDVGETLRDAFGQIGSAGGHADMAGAQVPMGVLGDTDDSEELAAIVRDVVTDRFFETLRERPSWDPGPPYDGMDAPIGARDGD
jgi:nanoRNase/pAp phosphatase (c-di-AMP/oligoRNAs hydrolase)